MILVPKLSSKFIFNLFIFKIKVHFNLLSYKNLNFVSSKTKTAKNDIPNVDNVCSQLFFPSLATYNCMFDDMC